jgi:hypothetical protein
MKHYYACRPASMPDHIRIERASTATEALKLAFGRGAHGNWQVKDLGTRVQTLRSYTKLKTILKDTNGWEKL